MDWALPRLRVVHVLAIAIFAVFVWSSLQAQERKAINKWPIPLEIFAGEKAELDPQLLASAARNVAQNPDDLDSLAALTLNSVQAGESSPSTLMQKRILESRGMRSTRAQVLLLFDAAKNDRLAEVIERIDVLLRRRQLTDFGYAVLAALERIPAGRSELVSVLAKDPEWRRAYLAWPEPITSADGRSNRGKTLDMLFEAASPPLRVESALAISALAENGDPQGAYRLWRKLNPKYPADITMSDPTFAELVQFRQLDGWWSTPFDWKLYDGDEAEVRVKADDGTAVHIYWDGRGSPNFLSQTLRNIENELVAVVVGLDQNSGQFADALEVRLECPGDVMVLPRVAGLAEEGVVGFRSERTIPCPFPWLRISGNSGAIRSTIEFDIQTVRVTK
jgi:hypothetical protein